MNVQTNKLNRNTLGRTAALALTAALGVTAQAFNQYQIVDLGTLTGGSWSRATGVNDKGHVVGVADNSQGHWRGFFWNGSTKTTINPDSAGDNGAGQQAMDSSCMGLNNEDVVVGYRDRYYSLHSESKDRAFKWDTTNGTITNISNFAADFAFNSRAYDINEFGTVTGHATGKNGSTAWQPFRYTTNSGTVWTGSLTGSNQDNCYSFGINESAQIAGYGENALNEYIAYRFVFPNFIQLGKFPNPLIFEPPFETFGADLNDAGTVVGYYKVDFNTYRAFKKTSSGDYEGLGLLPGSDQADDSAIAAAINNNGDVVGDCEVGNALHRAFLYLNNGRSMLDLNTVIPANSGWTLEFATDISDKGHIVGYGKKNGAQRAFLLKPTVIITGTISLQDWMPSLAGRQVAIQVIDAATNSYDETNIVTLNAAGQYSFETTRTGMKYLKVAHSHWLIKHSPTMNFTSNFSNVNFSLVNGDIDSDNEVGIGDYAMLSAAYNTVPGDLAWLPNADLSGDQSCDIGDYAILSNNYGMNGD